MARIDATVLVVYDSFFHKYIKVQIHPESGDWTLDYVEDVLEATTFSSRAEAERYAELDMEDVELHEYKMQYIMERI